MQRVGARADAIVKTVEHCLCDQYSAAMLKDAIEMALKEQDKLTRHAIAEALSEKSLSLDDFPVKGGFFLKEQQAHSIAMNTNAL